MATKRKTIYGNTTGTTNSKFRTVIEIYADDNKADGYNVWVRCYLQVTAGNFNGTTMSTSWGKTAYVTGTGTYADSGLVSKGKLSYGKSYSASASSQYSASSGTTYKSSASGSWTCPTPTYAVNYDANGGEGAPSAQTKTYGVTLKLSATIPTRKGYIFMGWGKSDTTTTVSYAPGASYTANAAITLYAVWKYGADVCVKVGDAYKYGNAYVRINGHYQKGDSYVRNNGTYKRGSGG